MQLTWIEKFGVGADSSSIEYFSPTSEFILLSDDTDINKTPFYVLVRNRGIDIETEEIFNFLRPPNSLKFTCDICSDYSLGKIITMNGFAKQVSADNSPNLNIYRLNGLSRHLYSTDYFTFQCSTTSITTGIPLWYEHTPDQYPHWSEAPDLVEELDEWKFLIEDYNELCKKLEQLRILIDKLFTTIRLIRTDTNKPIYEAFCKDKAKDNIRLLSYRLTIETSNLFFDSNKRSLSFDNFRKKIINIEAKLKNLNPNFAAQILELLNIFPEKCKWNSLFATASSVWFQDGKRRSIFQNPLLKTARDKKRAHTERGFQTTVNDDVTTVNDDVFFENIYPEISEARRGVSISHSVLAMCYWGLFQNEKGTKSITIEDVVDLGLHPDMNTVWEFYDMLPPEKYILGLRRIK